MGLMDNVIKLMGGATKEDLTEAIDDALTSYRAEEDGWIHMGDADSRPEPTMLGRINIYNRAEVYWFSNPLIGQAVNLKTWYTFGRGIQITHIDENVNKVLQRFWNDPRNKAELTSFEGQTDKDHDLQAYGNVFLTFFPQVDGTVFVRSIPTREITEIVTDPDDGKRVLWYKRVRSVQIFDFESGAVKTTGTETKFYQDWRYYLEAEGISGYTVPDDVRTDMPVPPANLKADGIVMHLHVNKLGNALFGISDFYRAIDWAKAHKDQLEDWATIVRALSTFAWKRKSKSGIEARTSATRMGGSSVTTPADRPAGVASILHQPPNVDYEAVSPPKGATTSPEDSRQLKLMVAAGTGIFEHYFGDPSTGNLATSKSMELPMLKMFEARQQMWEEYFLDICEFVLRVKFRTNVPETIKEAKSPDSFNDKTSALVDAINVEFPPIVQKDIVESAQALILGLAAAQGTTPLIPMEQAAALFMSLLGVDDVQDKVKNLKTEWATLKTEKAAAAEKIAAQFGSQQDTNGIPGASPARAGKPPDLKTPLDKTKTYEAEDKLRETAAMLLAAVLAGEPDAE